MKVETPAAQQAIGKYPIIREIGIGATSRVYLARDPRGARRRHQGAAVQAGGRSRYRAHHAQDVRRRSLARRQAPPPAHRRYLRRGGRARPQLPGDGVRRRQDAGRASSPGNLLPLAKVVEIIFCASARWSTPSRTASSTATSSRGTSCSPPTATKVGDFGASFQQRLDDRTTQLKGIGSPAYMSPSSFAWRRSPTRPISTRSA